MALADIPPAPAGEAAPAASPPESLMQQVKGLLQELPGLVSDRVHLLALELRRSAQALAMMVGLVLAAAILGATAWVALWIGLAAALIEAGLAWGWVLLIVLALNIGAAVFALMRASSLAHLLTLPATVRRLTVAPPESPPTPSTSPRHEQHHGTPSDRPLAS